MVFHEENTYIRWMAYRVDELFFLIRFADRFRLVSYDIMALVDLTSRAVGYDYYL